MDMNNGLVLRMHNSVISGICLNEKESILITSGRSDETLIKWEIKELIIEENSLDFQFYKLSKDSKIVLLDTEQKSELLFFIEATSNTATDIDDKVAVRGFDDSLVKNLFSHKMGDLEKSVRKLNVQVSLQIDHVYGPHNCFYRKSCAYLHVNKIIFEPNNDDVIKKIMVANTVQVNEIMEKIRDKRKYQREKHSNCHRNVIYPVSKYCIMLEPNGKSQQIADFHRNTITAFAIHPHLDLIATGESGKFPKIIVFNYVSMVSVVQIRTNHLGSVMQMCYSAKGAFLISIGCDETFSISIISTCLYDVIYFQNTGNFPIFDMKFYPKNEAYFITCGYRNITVWEIKGNMLTKQKVINSEEFSLTEENTTKVKTFLCIEFINIKIGNTVISDIIFGSNLGDISAISCDKYFVAKKNAHEGQVNKLMYACEYENVLN